MPEEYSDVILEDIQSLVQTWSVLVSCKERELCYRAMIVDFCFIKIAGCYSGLCW